MSHEPSADLPVAVLLGEQLPMLGDRFRGRPTPDQTSARNQIEDTLLSAGRQAADALGRELVAVVVAGSDAELSARHARSFRARSVVVRHDRLAELDRSALAAIAAAALAPLSPGLLFLGVEDRRCSWAPIAGMIAERLGVELASGSVAVSPAEEALALVEHDLGGERVAVRHPLPVATTVARAAVVGMPALTFADVLATADVPAAGDPEAVARAGEVAARRRPKAARADSARRRRVVVDEAAAPGEFVRFLETIGVAR